MLGMVNPVLEEFVSYHTSLYSLHFKKTSTIKKFSLLLKSLEFVFIFILLT